MNCTLGFVLCALFFVLCTLCFVRCIHSSVLYLVDEETKNKVQSTNHNSPMIWLDFMRGVIVPEVQLRRLCVPGPVQLGEVSRDAKASEGRRGEDPKSSSRHPPVSPVEFAPSFNWLPD